MTILDESGNPVPPEQLNAFAASTLAMGEAAVCHTILNLLSILEGLDACNKVLAAMEETDGYRVPENVRANCKTAPAENKRFVKTLTNALMERGNASAGLRAALVQWLESDDSPLSKTDAQTIIAQLEAGLKTS